MPLWFEDFAAMGPDDELVSPARTVTEADIVSFAAWTGDYNPVHTDAVAAAAGRFGERIAHGVLGVAFCLGLISRTGAFEGSAVALLGIDGWTFRAPVRIGDTVHTRVRVVGTRLTSRGDAGVVQRLFTLVNQEGVVTQEGRMDVMVKTRP
ncbi:MaoC family dehydratase N-terminal domain-containing protein [Pseudonocardia sp. RS11V-5]|uniref:MaoC/PaaZ C-terminal domain-containing protein n=1 Tax=Pseudonocardia terrae TaxID=2905831 RepID=UPI001E46A565|nr:MaoC/PaaZ C-terminal domain-containing protein [Pseudonocardia terrae]MCE3550645.1 MaoC family dehydratase N-terminal domain-containing protein [Pseudonocardia terrae]